MCYIVLILGDPHYYSMTNGLIASALSYNSND